MKYLLFILLIIGSFCTGRAQDPPPGHLSPERMQEIRAQKSAYLTTKLSLTPEEAQRFWPVYNKYDEASGALRRELRDMDQRLRRNGTAMTDAEAIKFMELEVGNRQKELDLLKQFQGESRKLIGAVRTVELGRAERDFHREMLKRYRGGGDRDRSGKVDERGIPEPKKQ